MKKTLLLVGVLSCATAALAAEPTCNAPEERWMNEVYFQTELEARGFKVDEIKVSAGKCYEMTGIDKDGKKVALVFDPETLDQIARR